ncbi:molybdate ABC transporter substrate-binding protein [Anaeroselena agilis]|uniref:Molybdate ABC transporter substrate-binding protein n=1 Tax=Anaeroselena agilis TaxID=3063788 RepID=A0ABU3NZG4_9FIRM|nr:molybdate ABC transporter substrate-binding protein [Selenomonadales bacterium 4137-cl]
MNKRFLWVFIGLIATLLAAGCGGGAKQAQAPAAKQVELNISAAASLKDALLEIQKNYQAKNPSVKLICNLASSGALQKQIEQGAPADVFISAAPRQMNDLEAKNLINKASRRNLVENKLVLVVPENSAGGLNKFEDLAGAKVQKFSMGETSSVPAGQYGQQVLKKLGLWEGVKDKAVFAKDVRAVLTYVATGNVDAGIVYKTDAVSGAKVKIAAIAPAGSHKPIVYPVAILSGAKQPKAAEEFLAYLTGPEGKAVFEKHGFAMSK